MSILIGILYLLATVLCKCGCDTSCYPNYYSVTALPVCYLCNTAIPHALTCACVRCTFLGALGTLLVDSCEPGYAASYDTCYPCTAPCKTCSSVTACQSCITGFFLDGTKCIVDNCKTMGGLRTCVECKPGYFLTNNGQSCNMCPPYCVACSDSVKCTLCVGGFVLTQAGICTLSNCKTMQGDLCVECEVGYYVLGDRKTCGPCQSVCRTCDKVAQNCTSCANSYTLVGETCFVTNCAKMSGNKCIECKARYYEVANGTLCLPCLQPCKECADNSTTCTSCIDDYVLDRYVCSIPQCRGYDNLKCAVCNPGFYLGPNKTSCPACDTNCATCAGTGTTCTSCTTGFMLNLSSNQCIVTNCKHMEGNICKDCGERRYPSINGSQCLPCDEQCLSCIGGSGICTSCNSSYVLTASSCSVPYCQLMNATSCNICMDGYYLADPLRCVQCIAPCAECSVRATNCTACIEGYDLADNICSIPKCIQTKGTTCEKCESGYYVSSSGLQCLPCALHCMTCSSATLCEACEPGYKFSPGSDACFDDQCGKCVHGKCEADARIQTFVCQCPADLVIYNSTCVKNICGTCTGGECKIDTAYVRYCDCGPNKGLYNDTCVNSTCGACANGICQYNSTTSALSCICNAGFALNQQGICVLDTLHSPAVLGGIISGVIILLLIIAAVLTTVLVLMKRRGLLLHLRKITSSDEQFSPFDNSANSSVIL